MIKTKYVFQHEFEDLYIETYDDFVEDNKIKLFVTEHGRIKEIKRVVQYSSSYGDLYILYKGSKYFLNEFEVENDGEGN